MKNHYSLYGTDHESPTKIANDLQSQPKLSRPPPKQGDWIDTTSHHLKAGGAAVFRSGASVALTGAVLFAGMLGMTNAASVTLPGPATTVIIFTLVIGSVGASPTVARLILVWVHRHLAGSTETGDDTAAEIVPTAIGQHSEGD